MAPVGGPLANVVTVTAVSNAKDSTHASTVPFGPPSPIASALGQRGLWGASAFGAEDCLSTATHQIPIVNSVHSSCSSFTSNGFVPVTVPDPVPVPVSVDIDSSAQDILGGGKSLVPFISPSSLTLSSVPGALRQDLVPPSSVSPIDAEKLWQELSSHPDQTQVNYVVSGLRCGFHVGFNPQAAFLKSAIQNMPSASLMPSVIDQHLITELGRVRVAGPFSVSPLPNLHISRFGIIPKKYQPGRWRLILDLSSPTGHSMNDGIPREFFSVYT